VRNYEEIYLLVRLISKVQILRVGVVEGGTVEVVVGGALVEVVVRGGIVEVVVGGALVEVVVRGGIVEVVVGATVTGVVVLSFLMNSQQLIIFLPQLDCLDLNVPK
jgi:hypothetical protein